VGLMSTTCWQVTPRRQTHVLLPGSTPWAAVYQHRHCRVRLQALANTARLCVLPQSVQHRPLATDFVLGVRRAQSNDVPCALRFLSTSLALRLRHALCSLPACGYRINTLNTV